MSLFYETKFFFGCKLRQNTDNSSHCSWVYLLSNNYQNNFMFCIDQSSLETKNTPVLEAGIFLGACTKNKEHKCSFHWKVCTHCISTRKQHNNNNNKCYHYDIQKIATRYTWPPLSPSIWPRSEVAPNSIDNP